MTAPRTRHVRLFVCLITMMAALTLALFARRASPTARATADADAVRSKRSVGAIAAPKERWRAAVGDAPTRSSELHLGYAGSAALAEQPAMLDAEELARRREQRREQRAARHAASEERGREARASARVRALEHAKGDPEQVERLQAQFARRDERQHLREERHEQHRKLYEERARNPEPSRAVKRASDAPVLGPPVIGADGVAYNPHDGAHSKRERD